jgi:SNF2 family DNA or RNA helicase
LKSGKMRVKVLPDARFGLIHGKAGVVTTANGACYAFMGSANESRAAWSLNYEIVWVDESAEGVTWVQEEFDALWYSPDSVDLADAVVEDIGRLARRGVIATLGEWQSEDAPDPAAPIVELPVYRREGGLWAHQKVFIRMAFEAHQRGGARYVLADQVGLGKTVQLGLAAKLMALIGEKPVLILTPRPLMEQWQGELWSLLAFPTARWNGRQWIDENGIAYPDMGPDGLRRCPRRAGIVSTGLIKRQSEGAGILETMNYECVILDEAHHARRQNLGPTHKGEPPEATNLLRFLKTIARRAKSLLLATATPVQIAPIEAWDLLAALAEGTDAVLGDQFSLWRREAWRALDLVMGRAELNEDADPIEVWEWVRNPLPPAGESRDFAILRRGLDVPDDAHVVVGSHYRDLRASDRRRLDNLRSDLFREHHPFIRHIVRRTRAFLETTIDPTTSEPYLKPVHVRLHGEGDDEAIILPAFLEQAYRFSEEFCREVARRPGLSSGFLKTMLLRRVGSSIEAGRLTAEKMLRTVEDGEDLEDADDNERLSALYPLEEEEQRALQAFVDALRANQDEDPKLYETIKKLDGGWLDLGCIIFSQYYDSVLWLARKLSERLPDERIAIYSGAARSGLIHDGVFTPLSRDEIKRQVQSGDLRLLIGTDAASEGLNLQRLGTLINLDLPWNPTRLEQRKGRIQRIGQLRDSVDIFNMRYKGSIEDRVHELLSQRLENIRDMFGQVPDTLEAVWVEVALAEEERAKRIIETVPKTHPFEMRYDRIESVNWETCARVLDAACQLDALREGW